MRYTTTIELNSAVEKVITLFDDPENMKEWQPELLSFDHLSGEAGQPGAKSKLKYQMGKRQVEMIETIINRNLPDEFSGTYEANGVYNKVVNKFLEKPENKTTWVTENEFRFKGFMKLFAFFMPGAFKKQTLIYMQRFKDFAEKN